MDEQEWVDFLQKEKVKEFSFFPHAFTPIEQELDIELPDLEFGAEEEKEDDSQKNKSSTTGNTVKTISLTLGGLTLGVVLGAGGASYLTPETSCVQPTVTQQTQTQPQTQATTPASAPAPTASSPATAVTPQASSTATPAGSADGTLPARQ